jgi:15-cis-phytoene synthase
MTVQAQVDLVRLSGEIMQAGSKSFAAASKLFDSQTRASAQLLYAWCRHCDDAIDGQELGFQQAGAAPYDSVAALERLKQMTGDALDGKPMSDPVFAAFQQVVQKHAIPRRHPLELLEGFAMDAAGRRYGTITDTLSYCYHVAGVVGVMMAIIMGARDEDTLDRACDLGLAFQLTNIARDVIDDAAVGRVYLPQSWLDEAGIEPRDILQERNRPALHDVVARLLALAEGYYDSGAAGIAHLPARSRWAIATARVVYREIGREVLRRGPRAWDRRVSTSEAQKILAAVRGVGAVVAVRNFGGAESSRDGLWTRPK